MIAIVDTNANPAVIDYPIPGNDDAIRSIRILLQNLVDSIVVGSKSEAAAAKKEAAATKKEAAAKKEVVEAKSDDDAPAAKAE